MTTKVVNRLLALDGGADGIQRMTAYFSVNAAKPMCEAWMAAIQKAVALKAGKAAPEDGAPPPHPDLVLTLLYIANDVLQKTRATTQDFVTAFATYLPAAFALAAEAIPERSPKFLRLLNIWEERGVYTKSFMDRVRAGLPAGLAPAEPTARAGGSSRPAKPASVAAQPQPPQAHAALDKPPSPTYPPPPLPVAPRPVLVAPAAPSNVVAHAVASYVAAHAASGTHDDGSDDALAGLGRLSGSSADTGAIDTATAVRGILNGAAGVAVTDTQRRAVVGSAIRQLLARIRPALRDPGFDASAYDGDQLQALAREAEEAEETVRLALIVARLNRQRRPAVVGRLGDELSVVISGLAAVTEEEERITAAVSKLSKVLADATLSGAEVRVRGAEGLVAGNGVSDGGRGASSVGSSGSLSGSFRRPNGMPSSTALAEDDMDAFFRGDDGALFGGRAGGAVASAAGSAAAAAADASSRRRRRQVETAAPSFDHLFGDDDEEVGNSSKQQRPVKRRRMAGPGDEDDSSSTSSSSSEEDSGDEEDAGAAAAAIASAGAKPAVSLNLGRWDPRIGGYVDDTTEAAPSDGGVEAWRDH